MRHVTWTPHFNTYKGLLKNRKKANGSRNTPDSNTKTEVTNFITKIVEGTYFKSKRLRKVIRTKITRFPMYKFERKNNCIIKSFKYGNFSQWKSHYNVSSTNRVVGITPDYVGFGPSKIVRSPNYFIKFIKDGKFRSGSESLNTDLYKSLSESRIVYSGGFDTCDNHIREYFKDNSPTSFKVEEIFKILSDCNCLHLFKSPKIDFYDSRELDFFVRVNLDANPGHYCSRLVGETKSSTNETSRVVAKRLFNYMKKHTLKNNYLWSLGKREKDIKLVGDDEPVSTRVVLFCEDPMTTLLSWFSQKYYCTLRDERIKYKIHGDYDANKARSLYKRLNDFDYYLDSDWTFFDSNQDSSFIEAALLLLTSALPKDKLHDRIRYLIISSNVTKNVVIPPGIVVELNRANASGHPFTTLLNCNVNLIYWCLIGFKMYGNDFLSFMDFEVYGDDALVFFKDHPNLFEIDTYVRELNLKSEPLSNKLCPVSDSIPIHMRPDFLKRRWDGSKIIWNYKKMFDRLFYQSKNRGINDQVDLLFSYLDTSGDDEHLWYFASRFLNWMKRERLIDQLSYDTKERVYTFLSSYSDYEERTSNFTVRIDTKSNVPYFSKELRIASWSVSGERVTLGKPGFKQISAYNNNREKVLYLLAFPPAYLGSKGYAVQNLNRGVTIFNDDAAYLDGLRKYYSSLALGLTNKLRKSGFPTFKSKYL